MDTGDASAPVAPTPTPGTDLPDTNPKKKPFHGRLLLEGDRGYGISAFNMCGLGSVVEP